MILLFYPGIFFNIYPVDACIFNFLNSTLNECVILNADGKCKIIAFPFSGTAIFQVFGIQTIGKGITASSRNEHLEYCSAREWEGNDFTFTITIKDDTLIQSGIEKIESAGINRVNIEKYTG